MEDDDSDDELAVRHVSKRARHRKDTVVAFNDADRREYLTGFRKRKNERREVALKQKFVKERQKRIQSRRERRQALKANTEDGEDGGQPTGLEQSEDEQIMNEVDRDVSGTATYEDAETTTLVSVTNLTGDEEDADMKVPFRHTNSESHGADHKVYAKKLKVPKAKFKKQKKPNSEKRKRKTTKRDNSMSKHSRSRNRKATKK